MTTSDQDGQHQLTRKQLREIRLTGSTPVITEAEAAAASQPAAVLPRAAEPVEIAPVLDIEAKEADAPLTRRQMRALEHAHPVADDNDEAVEPEVVESEAVESEDPAEEQQLPGELVSGVPAFEQVPATAEVPRFDASDAADDEADGEGSDPESETDVAAEPEVEPGSSDRDQVAAIFDAPVEDDAQSVDPAAAEIESGESDDEADELEVVTAERPVVGAAFGLGVKPEKPVGALFDDLLDGRSSSGSHHSASTALIFTPSAGAGSLSGPIASTGELLITGTYSLPDGIGSQGHAHGTADGRDADAVLLDGELAPASSPTPIAASSAISTSKSAGEVIRPPVPDKGNKLMLTLAIVAGGLALALAATLIIAATTGVFG
ncbi:hypothetical protein QF046_000217 [Microbacterium sp. W4I4]|uniref:hypothetical protein n=1 Tax=Microbacterium sp. W4I4 TaxID=3042295 RepID=UPI0027855D5C|nr:hypothetical protein [Microbacterium sp. W4I4]MDQ0612576.1 hypothetical protein [Microbacterium sp. W4I4]